MGLVIRFAPCAGGSLLKPRARSVLITTTLVLFWLTALTHAQFRYTVNINLTVTIEGYTGTNDQLLLPDVINGLPVTSIAPRAFYASGVKSLAGGSSVTSIGDYAFANCRKLSFAAIPNTVTNFGEGVFSNCVSLLGAAIPFGMNIVPKRTFAACSGLKGVDFPNTTTSIGEEAFRGCVSLTNVTIPNSVTMIGASAFEYCPGLTNITIGHSVASIGKDAFRACSGLISVSIPDSVTSIGDSAFNSCRGLTTVTIGNGVRTIGSAAFAGLENLRRVLVGRGVTTIGRQSFSTCFNLAAVYFQGDAPSLQEGSSFLYDPLCIIYYLPGTVGWSSSLGGRPAVLWNPQVQNVGFRGNQFGFRVLGNYMVLLVETAADITSNSWQPLQTITVTGGECYFTDTMSTNTQSRFYRIALP